MDSLTDFACLPLFHPVLYEKEALKLKEGQNEEGLDETLRNQALAAGIEVAELDKTVAQLNRLSITISPVRRSSVSGDTQASYPSDVTTPESPCANDRLDNASLASSAMFSTSPPPSTPASNRYSRFSGSGFSSMRASLKDKLRKQSTRLRGRSTGREDESAIVSTRHERPGYSNRFSSYIEGRGIHRTVQNRDDSASSATDFDVHSLALMDPSRPSSSDSLVAPQATLNGTISDAQRAALKLATENQNFAKMWAEYCKTFERISSFEIKQRNLLQFYEKFSETTLANQKREWKEMITQKNAKEMEDVNRRQAGEQFSLFRTQQKAHENSMNALKHMKRYCSGSTVADLQKRRVTEEDKKRLKAQEKAHQDLEVKHQNAMVSLEQRQEKEKKDRLEAHEKEWKKFEETSMEAAATLRRICRDLERQLNDLIRSRRLRAIQRWNLDVRLWEKSTPEDADVPSIEDIPSIPWPDRLQAETFATRSSSILDTYITFNNLPPVVSLRASSMNYTTEQST